MSDLPVIASGYRVRKLSNEADPAVRRAYQFMKTYFAGESETFGWLIRSMEDDLNQYFVVEDSNRTVVALSNSQYLRIRGRARGSLQSIVVIWHIAVDPDHRGKGLAKSLYRTIYEDALNTARRRKHEVLAIVGEAMDEVEGLLNALGRKRLYYRQGNNWEEVSYLCPPLDYDQSTGAVIGAMTAQHLMVRFVDSRTVVSLDGLEAIVNTMYHEYLGARRDYESYRAYVKAKTHLSDLAKEFSNRVGSHSDGQIYLLSRNLSRRS